MKIKKIIGFCGLPSLLVASAIAFTSAKPQKANEAKAETDVGTVTVGSVRNNAGDHFDNNIYLVLNETTALPDSWDYPYTAVGESSGVFINGEKQTSAVLKHANGNDIHYGLPRALNDGDVVEFKGTFSTDSAGGYTFSIDYETQRFGGDWVHGLEDYDVVSLKDANMPDFEDVSINTEDTAGYGYIGYDEGGYAKKFAAKQKGLFGLTNETGSYAFQFNFEANGLMTNWLTVRIGASGGWTTGHYLKFNFTNMYHEKGCVIVSENEGAGDYSSHKLEVSTNLQDGERLLKMGAIKIKGSANKFYVFVLNNGVTNFGQYWDLASGTMSTKVGIYAPDTNISISNSLNPVETKVTLSASSTASSIYFNTATDILPFVHTWSEYFIPQDSATLTYNSVDASNNKFNYFKKVAATNNSLFLGLGDLGITPASGDIIHLGGIFKMARYASSDNVTVLYKIVIQSCDFQFDGTKWIEVNLEYSAEDFAKDLLKLTLPVCSTASDGNGSALSSVWTVLADGEHYASLVLAQKDIIKGATSDSTIVVPSTASAIDGMSSANAIAAAAYRYDYCSAKYSLTNFIDRTITVSFGSNLLLSPFNNESTNIVVIIAVISLVSISFVGLFVYKKKHR